MWFGRRWLRCEVSESNYSADFERLVLPFVEKHAVEGQFTAADGTTIRHVSFVKPDARASILLLPGWTEPFVKYYETAFDFWQRGFSVFVIDHRAQGTSTRCAKNTCATWVREFEEYVQDALAFLDRVVAPASPNGVFLLGHSMGGAIALWMALTRKDAFLGAMLLSPLIEILAPLPNRFLYQVARAACAMGMSTRYVPGHGKSWLELPFEQSWTTHSRARWERERECLRKRPELMSLGASYGWVTATMRASWELLRRAPELTLPTLMLVSGNESRVCPKAQEAFAQRSPNVRKFTIPGAMHELLSEADCYRDMALNHIDTFLAERLAASRGAAAG